MGQSVREFLKNKEIAQANIALSGEQKPLQVIEIDGNKISGYDTYSFYYQKTYPTEPQRSLGGVIDNLDSYATFITPTVKIHFNALSLDQYRTIMKLIYEKNEFVVKCYDVVYDKVITFKAYFTPDEYPELFQYNLELLAILNYEVELIGTNATLETVSIIYHTNPPSSLGIGDSQIGSTQAYIGDEVIVGSGIIKPTYDGYNFNGWSTAINDGINYVDDSVIRITQSIVLYAQWVGSNEFTLSYNYGIATPDDADLTSKTIVYGNAVGTLPTDSIQSVTYDGVEYTPYIDMGWYWTTKASENARVTASTIYNKSRNSTIYHIVETEKYTISLFYSENGSLNLLSTITNQYNESITLPTTINGKSVDGWYKDSSFVSSSKFTDTTMPPRNITLYAKLT